MTKHLIRYVVSVLVLIFFFIVPVSADLTAFDASVEGDTIVVTGTTSENETVDIVSTFVTDVNVKDGEYEYELEDIPIPDVNGDETLNISASSVLDMAISLKVKTLHIWNTTIIADAAGAASYTTPIAENCIDCILDKAGIGGTVLEKPAKVVMSYAAKLVDGSPVDLNIKIKGVSEDKTVSIEQAVHRTILADGDFSIEYDTNGLPAGTYVISATTEDSSESVTLKLKPTKEVPEVSSDGGARAYYLLKAAREKAEEEIEEEAEEEIEEEAEEETKPKTIVGEKSTKMTVDENVSETDFKTTEPKPALRVIVDFINAIIDFFKYLWR